MIKLVQSQISSQLQGMPSTSKSTNVRGSQAKKARRSSGKKAFSRSRNRTVGNKSRKATTKRANNSGKAVQAGGPRALPL